MNLLEDDIIFFENILSFIFPRTCGICGEKINSRYTCEKCLNILKYYKGRCYINRKDLLKSNLDDVSLNYYGKLNKYNFDFIIYDDNVKDIYYDKVICAHRYCGEFRRKMIAFKFYGFKSISKCFGDLLARIIENNQIKADIIIPVPVSKRRHFVRGYNQSFLIADTTSKLTQIKIENSVLIKSRDNHKQSLLSLEERIENTKNVFEVKNSEKIRNKNVILIDDIYTTGATVNECSRILKNAGAKSVIVLTVLYSDKR